MKLAIKLAVAASILTLATPALACEGMKQKTADKEAKAASAKVATAREEARPARAEAKKTEAKVATAAN